VLTVDWRLAPLVVFIKHWAKVQGINDASQGTVSSYSLVLMIIHYLQCKRCTQFTCVLIILFLQYFFDVADSLVENI
jgi:DNA polymerase sigma